MRRIQCQSFTKPIPFQMGLQVSRGICTQTTTEGDLRADTSSTGTNFPWSGATERMADYRRSPNARPCPHVHRDSAQASSRIRDRFLKGKSAIALARLSGKERNFSGEPFWAR